MMQNGSGAACIAIIGGHGQSEILATAIGDADIEVTGRHPSALESIESILASVFASRPGVLRASCLDLLCAQ